MARIKSARAVALGAAAVVMAGPADKGLRVAHKGSGSFWRGGHEFTGEPRTLVLADLTPEQADEIIEEGDKVGGWLVVTEVDVEPPAAEEKPAA